MPTLPNIGKIFIMGIYCPPAEKQRFIRQKGVKMIKRTKTGKDSNGSGWGRATCDDGCDAPTNGREVILFYRPQEEHVERYLTECFLKIDPRYRARYEIALTAVAALDVRDAAEGNGCNICGFQPRRREVIVCYVHGEAGRKFFMHFACFMGEDILRSVPNVHIGTAYTQTPILALPKSK